jgi:Undecaprenyl-phosphate glucose phosphotransferase
MKIKDSTFIYFIGDIAASALSFILAYYSRFYWFTGIIPVYFGIPSLLQYTTIYIVFTMIWPIAFYMYRLYYLPRSRSRIDEIISMAVMLFVSVFATFAAILYYRVYHQRTVDPANVLEPARIFIIYLLVISIIIFSLMRLFIRFIIETSRRLGYQLENVIIAGFNELSLPLAERIFTHKELGYNLVAFIDDNEPTTYQGIPVLNKLDDILEYCEKMKVSTLIVAFKAQQHLKLMKVLKATHSALIDVKVIPDLLDYIALSTGLEEFLGIPIINLNETPLKGINAVIKRVMDCQLSLIALAILSPLLILIALVIKLTSKGSVIYKQERISLDGARFMIYKFRSMYTDAEKETGVIMTAPDDKRKTKVGSILRALNFDELPQFYNVLKGDMSIVGPRPERPEFVDEFRDQFPQYMLRHKVRPGITGWAQINGCRGKTANMKRRLELDLFYIENWSILFDLKIMIMSFYRAFKQAY